MSKTVYQLRIDLVGSKPPIWRRILIDPDRSMHDLHCAIQNAMGWMNSHLHSFEKGGVYFEEPNEEFDDLGWGERYDEHDYSIGSVLMFEKDYINYTYDFGDDWQHKIRLEKILPYDPDQPLPACIKGKNACPPDDIGGLWGYYDFLEIINDPEHPEHDEYAEWVGCDTCDPTEFDLQETDMMMREGCRDWMYG